MQAENAIHVRDEQYEESGDVGGQLDAHKIMSLTYNNWFINYRVFFIYLCIYFIFSGHNK